MYLTRREILDEMNLRKYGLSIQKAEKFTHDFFQALKKSLCRTHKSYRERYFGAFKVHYWAARDFRNSSTGKIERAPESFRLRFAPSLSFKRELNKK